MNFNAGTNVIKTFRKIGQNNSKFAETIARVSCYVELPYY